MLNVKRLSALRVVAGAGSFSAAAEELSLTPSAVSQQMHALERESGVVLFERVSSGVRLTEAGGSLVVHADAILARVSEAEAELRAIKAGRLGRLRLGSFPTATDVFVAHAVEVFRREHPGIDVQFEAGRPTESLSRLEALELDIAVIFTLQRWDATSSAKGKAGFRQEMVEYIHLYDEPYLLVVPPDHRFADTDAVQVSDSRASESWEVPRAAPPGDPICSTPAGKKASSPASSRSTGHRLFATYSRS